jgi:hypothetical protein
MKTPMQVLEVLGDLVIRVFCRGALKPVPPPSESTLTATEGRSFANYTGYSEDAMLDAHASDRPGE